MSRLRDLLNDLWERLRPPAPPRLPPSPPPPVPPPTPKPPSGLGTVTQLLDAHNAQRAARGLKPLVLSNTLNAAAALHADDMARHKNMSHTGSDGSDPFQRMARAGYHYSSAGENIAAGQKDVAAVMTSWMNSSGHRANILGNYTDVGFGVGVGPDGWKYWCADFGTPSGARSFTILSKDGAFPGGVDGREPEPEGEHRAG